MIREPESNFKIAHSLEVVYTVSCLQHQGCIVCSLELIGMEVEVERSAAFMILIRIDYFDLLDLACHLWGQSTPPPNCYEVYPRMHFSFINGALSSLASTARIYHWGRERAPGASRLSRT